MTDLLHADILVVGNRQYRLLASQAPRGGQHARQKEQHGHQAVHEADAWGGVAPGSGWDGGDEEVEQPSFPIAEEGGRFLARLRLDAELFPHLIGQKGRTRQRVEQDTGAELSFPSRGAQAAPGASSAVVVTAASRAAVARACTQLELLISQALAARGNRSLDYNYFLCLPLANPDTCARFEAFRAAGLAEPGAAAAGLEEYVFMHPKHLHLTIAMLKLYSDERRALARQTLHSLAPRVAALLADQPLHVRLRGLEYMNDDPAQMHVMYVGVQDAEGSPGGLQLLQQLCAEVVEAFSQAGLLLPQDERAVKLHATVINSRYRLRAASAGGGGGPQHAQGQGRQQRDQRQAFDGRMLLERHAAVDFGEVALPAVHLSQRGRYDAATGFYHCVDSLALS